MPRLNHANLPVADVAALRDFFVRWFGFTQERSRGRDAFVVLRGEDGFVLDTPDAVRDTHAAMRDAGLALGDVQALRRGGPDSVTFYCYAPNAVLIEVSSV